MKYILFYKGPTTPSDASHKGWVAWFTKLGDALVDHGSPMSNGAVIHDDGSISDATTSFNGYSVIQAKDKNEALSLIKDHPYLGLGNEYTIEFFEKG
jgi:hypothetical protein